MPRSTYDIYADPEYYVYYMGENADCATIKIGHSEEPYVRLRRLQTQTGRDLQILHKIGPFWSREKAREKEAEEHHRFRSLSTGKGEWFHNRDHLKDFIYRQVYGEFDDVVETLMANLTDEDRAYFAELDRQRLENQARLPEIEAELRASADEQPDDKPTGLMKWLEDRHHRHGLLQRAHARRAALLARAYARKRR